jgi:hypothetical protein
MEPEKQIEQEPEDKKKKNIKKKNQKESKYFIRRVENNTKRTHTKKIHLILTIDV